MANINIGIITFDSQGFCYRCNKYSVLGTSLKISQIKDHEYIKLQQNNWRRSGQMFFHTNQNSCCQQEIINITVNQYIPSKNCNRSLRKYTTEYVQTKYNNLFSYTNKFRPSLETLQTQKAFDDFFKELSIYLDCTQMNSKGFMHHSHDILCSQVFAVNQKLQMNVRVDKNNILHFQWPKNFINFLKKREQNKLEITQSNCNYDEEAHNLFNQNYFEVNKPTFEKMFCDQQFKIIKYKLNQELIAVSYLETRQNSLHRITFHHSNRITEINRISINHEIQIARQQNLSHYYFVKIIQHKQQQLTLTNFIVDENFSISCGNKTVQIKNLKCAYKKYIFELLTKLNQLMGSELFQLFEFKYY